MTIAGLVLGTLISELLFIATKVLFFHYLNIDNEFVKITFFVIIIIETIVVVRRLGIINYLESFLLMIVWFIAMMIADIAITATLIGRDFYGHLYYWLGNLFVLLAILFFHKALHVEVRRANSAHK